MQDMLLLYQSSEMQYNSKPTKCLLVFVLSCLKISCDVWRLRHLRWLVVRSISLTTDHVSDSVSISVMD